MTHSKASHSRMTKIIRSTLRLVTEKFRLVCFSVKTDLMEEGANSTLSIARVGPADSGNYTCHLTTMPDQPATVHVHVLNGENKSVSINFRKRLKNLGYPLVLKITCCVSALFAW